MVLDMVKKRLKGFEPLHGTEERSREMVMQALRLSARVKKVMSEQVKEVLETMTTR